MNAERKVFEFIVENFLFGDQNAFNSNTSILEENIIDSIGFMELVSFLEDTFEITINDDELIAENLDTITNITKFLEYKKNNQSI